ncbi:MAG: sodium:solute symporter [Acidobacteria bacterium]|nr:sodium:solute symporter [Acidobacteriota bacterium]
MRAWDWIAFAATLAYVVIYGVWKARGQKTARTFAVAERSVPWYAVGLSIMATQASAVTFISTTGQGSVDGMRFAQFYFGLPIAMVILSYTAVPLFRAANVITAYEYLERRFDARVRALVSGIFLLQRGLALGITLYAPAVVLTLILGWPDWATTVLMAGLAVTYTAAGGAKAIAWSDLQQMVVMTVGLGAALVSAMWVLPPGVSFSDALTVASAAGRLNVITTAFDWNDRYNLWSGLIGGAFLALAYFGTDQSQVQRYLSGHSMRDSRRGLMLNAVAKIPMQLCILLIGALVFVVYIYEKPPLIFQELDDALIQAPGLAERYGPIREQYESALAARRDAAERLVRLEKVAGPSPDVVRSEIVSNLQSAQRDVDGARREAAALAVSNGGSGASDTNYIFLTFVTSYLPVGVVGLVLAVVFGATMAAISAEMGALATVSVFDVYKRHVRPDRTDAHYLTASRVATVFWGIYAIGCAQLVKGLGSLVEAVNVLGSLFYGGMLGVFVLAFFAKRTTARGAFWAVLCGEATIFVCWYFTSIAFLWYNVIGCLVVVACGVGFSGWPARAPVRATPHPAQRSRDMP